MTMTSEQLEKAVEGLCKRVGKLEDRFETIAPLDEQPPDFEKALDLNSACYQLDLARKDLNEAQEDKARLETENLGLKTWLGRWRERAHSAEKKLDKWGGTEHETR